MTSDYWQSRYQLENHDSSKHSGATANLLTALTPTFANWTQNPGTNADIVQELNLDDVLTTNGIGAAGWNEILYDLGTSRRRIVYVKDISQLSAQIVISDDNINWYTLVDFAHPTTLYYGVGIGKFRYLAYQMNGVNTITFLRMICYNIN